MKLNCLMSLISGCSDFLDVKDESAINSAIWDSEQSAMLYVNNIYTMCLPSFGGDNVYGSISPSACSDEIGGDLNSLMEGSMDFGQVGAFSVLMQLFVILILLLKSWKVLLCRKLNSIV